MRDTLCLASETLRDALGAGEAHIIYVPAEEFCWASDRATGQKPISDSGLRHVQRRLAALGTALAFNSEADGRIEGLSPAREVQGAEWLALPFPGRGNHAEMLLVRGAWSGAEAAKALQVLEACLPSLTVLISRFLDGSHAQRQRQQLNALSDVARAITQTQEMESVLTRLATTIASVTDYEFVVLDVLDGQSPRLRFRCFNESRWSDSPQVRTWREWGLTRELTGPFLEMIRTGRGTLLPDMQHDERVPADMQEFFGASLLVSAAMYPLCFQDQVLGFLSVTSPRPHCFPPEETQLLEGLAAQAAAAIKAVQTYDELEQSRAQLNEYADRLRQAMEEQHRLARTDALTGIPNRRYVEEVLDSQCARARRDGSPLSVVLSDVDDFKRINDTFGHRAGDRTLVRLARLARRHCRAMDVVGRYGGDEFVFVLPLANLRQAVGFAGRLGACVARRPHRLGDDEAIRLTLSLGVAQFRVGDRGPDATLQRADEALYRAKALGKDQVCAEESRVSVA